jgi:hypothetical protein
MQLEANWSVSVRLRLTTAAAAAAAAAAPAAAAAQQRRLSLNRCACVRVCACVCVLASEQTQVSCAPFMDTLWFCFGALPSHCNHSSRCDPRHRFACGLLAVSPFHQFPHFYKAGGADKCIPQVRIFNGQREYSALHSLVKFADIVCLRSTRSAQLVLRSRTKPPSKSG